jgi:hypothetical protein
MFQYDFIAQPPRDLLTPPWRHTMHLHRFGPFSSFGLPV